MVFSMTGFGRAKQNISDFDISVEIRSVNHRYFEYSSRLPRAYMFMDDKLKSLCQQYISRGKVELSVFIENNNPNKISLEINEEYANAYFEALHKLAKKYKLKKILIFRHLLLIRNYLVLKEQRLTRKLF